MTCSHTPDELMWICQQFLLYVWFILLNVMTRNAEKNKTNSKISPILVWIGQLHLFCWIFRPSLHVEIHIASWKVILGWFIRNSYFIKCFVKCRWSLCSNLYSLIIDRFLCGFQIKSLLLCMLFYLILLSFFMFPMLWMPLILITFTWFALEVL